MLFNSYLSIASGSGQEWHLNMPQNNTINQFFNKNTFSQSRILTNAKKGTDFKKIRGSFQLIEKTYKAPPWQDHPGFTNDLVLDPIGVLHVDDVTTLHPEPYPNPQVQPHQSNNPTSHQNPPSQAKAMHRCHALHMH